MEVNFFFIIICRSVVSASEAAKAGIPLNDYQDNSQVCTYFECSKGFPFLTLGL